MSAPDSRANRPPLVQEVIRGLLNRKVLAAYRHRLAVARRLGMTESEVTALAYLAQGALTPRQLGERLLLTSGGVTALLHRLERAGHVTRERHPNDKRSVVLRADPAIIEQASQCYDHLTGATDEVTAKLSGDEQDIVRGFLLEIAEASEESVDAMLAGIDEAERPPDDDPAPIWA
ncbi:MAG TPA: MarR family transcriptional regulator [Solirubrobacteraceae bacterium]